MRFVLSIAVLSLFACAPVDPVSRLEAFAAVDADDAQTLRRFLDEGGSPNELADNGASMLYVATGPHGGEAVLELLLERGADANVGYGLYTPLMNASSWCWLDGVRLLVEAGADLHRKNERHETAMETVCKSGGDRDGVVAYLRARGASVSRD